MNRRQFLGCASTSILYCKPLVAEEPVAFRLGLTPVFLDNDAIVLKHFQSALESILGAAVGFEQRRTYEEVTGLLLSGSVDAAWLCGYPFLQHADVLSILAVPLWNGRPLYQSYLIVGRDDAASALSDLEGATHAFSDPDSNSGYLVTASELARIGRSPETFFRRGIFTYGHRNVVRAVADGLVRSGSVDGYVWEALTTREPQLTKGTRVIWKSEWMGFPPFCARSDRLREATVERLGNALRGIGNSDRGRNALDLLTLDGMAPASPGLFDGIAKRMAEIEAL
ncbi:PhnD/SsuA/transferrin family substrate-binding protein [Aliiruegeria lutimaris]|uniref:Phosphonate transport system substrate-binding protein n=1 Tax=Aliiruegeria lutimaris TaxID=571298 RepID=A0A1G8Q0A1_9RHOB|nr:PhnD/SsuA/transferrin family substrate-binding protein [Aliiruegeria lutimaris]SDI98199.1 phosphonate transport system substrate-binding protein [Aliiruegeria lutimaris]